MKSSATTVPELENHSAPQRFVRVRLTWASYWMLGYFAFLEAVLGPLMPFIRGELHLNYLLASLHFSAFALGAMAMGAVGDRLTRWWGRRASFWGGGVGMAAGAALLALSPSAVGTIAGALLMGLLGNLLLITIQAALADHHAAWSPVALTEANVVASGFALLASVSVGAITGVGWSWRLTLVLALALLAAAGARYHAVRFPAQATHAPAEAHYATPKNRRGLHAPSGRSGGSWRWRPASSGPSSIGARASWRHTPGSPMPTPPPRPERSSWRCSWAATLAAA